MSVSVLHRVVSLKEHVDELRALAAARRESMIAQGQPVRDWRARKNKTEDLFVLGFAGELAYELLTGWPMRRDHGHWDGGRDFPNGEDVKAIDVWSNPILMRHTRLPLHAAWYVLVAVDFPTWRATITGWASREEIAAAPVKEFGEGPTRCIPWWNLHTMGMAEASWFRWPS